MAQKTAGTAKKGGASKKPAPAKAAAPRGSGSMLTRRVVEALVCLFLGIFSFIGCFTEEGWFIAAFCGFFKGLLGMGYYLFPAALFVCALIFMLCRERRCHWRIICAMLLPLVIGALLHLLLRRAEYPFEQGVMTSLWESGKALRSGGVAAGLLSVGLESAVTVYGAALVFVCLIALFLGVSLDLTPAKIREWSREHMKEPDEYDYILPEKGRAPAPEPLPEAEPVYFPAEREKAPVATTTRRGRKFIDIPVDGEPPREETPAAGFFDGRPSVKTPDQLFSPPPADHTQNVQPVSVEEAAAIAGVQVAEIRSDAGDETSAAVVPVRKKRPSASAEVAAAAEEIKKDIEEAAQEEPEKYEYPPLELLRQGKGIVADGREEIALNRERLDATLRSFGVSAAIVDVTRGPTVTRYDLALEAGVKLNKITNLAGDLALSLGVASVRIAPIPDKISTVGIEVPNKVVSTVLLRDIIDSASFTNAQSKLTFAIGKDIGGNSIVGNISKLPHMLIAGTTGSGKSVCMNSLIISLLYKSTPDEVRLIMIDPKMVELGVYNGIPHLYVPVVTDPKKASGALQWAVVEMLKRYRLFSEAGVRDIAGYNNMKKRAGEPTMPCVVVVIDELADLMLVASKEVEESICRVAQMGRASGMHLVIATQRPSADVITGLMKANIPSRIAFAVSSAMESRIILDSQGAEKLVGQGDMLYSPLGGGKPQRIQGAFVSDEEREEVIAFIKSGSEAHYSDEIMSQIEKAAEQKSGNGKKPSFDGDDSPAEPVEGGAQENIFAGYDELLPQGVDVIFETKQASVSMLQRRLKLGYSRAARMVDQMEELGVVGPFEGSKPRQIMITKQQWMEMQMMNGTAPAEQLSFELEDGDGFEDDEPEDEDV